MPAGSGARTRPLHPLERRIQRVVWGDDAGATDAGERVERRLVVRGVVAVAFCAMLLATLHVFATPPFAPPDETSHIAYALAITDGYRPFVDEFPDTTRLPYWREGLSVWTANHPHLYNLVAGAPLRIGEALGRGVEAIWGARLVSVTALGAGLLLMGWLMVLLLPGRPAVAVGAPGVAGLFPHFVHVSGIAYNDSFAFFTTTATLVAATVVLRRGPTLRRVAVLAVAGSAAAGTRVSGLLALALAGLVAGAAPLLLGPGGWWARLRRGLAHGTLVAVVAASTVGWVYVQNLARYGGLTASQTLFDMFNREPRGLMWLRMARRDMWEFVHLQWWSQMDTTTHLPDFLLVPFRWWAPLVAAGLLLVVLRRLVTEDWRRRLPMLGPWVLLAGLLAGTVVTFGNFVARGGSPHARYFFPAAAVIGVLAATGLLALPGRRRGLPVAACTLSLLVANVVVLYRYASYPDLYGPVLVVRRWVMLGSGPLVPAAVVTLALLAGAFALYARSLWLLGPVSLPQARVVRDERLLVLRDPLAAVLVVLVGALAGAWVAYWFLASGPWGLGAVTGALVVGVAAWFLDRSRPVDHGSGEAPEERRSDRAGTA